MMVDDVLPMIILQMIMLITSDIGEDVHIDDGDSDIQEDIISG